MGKVFAYTRVSTPRQGQKGVSLPEQRAAISRYAEQRSLEIIRWFEDRDSAAKVGREAFTKMLRLVRLKAAEGVIIHKIDRSARNYDDWSDIGKLVDAGAHVHFVSENLDLKTVSGRLAADIQAVVAVHYSRNLREEVKKGLYGRLKQGFYPFRAPIGYLDQGAAKPKIPDPERAPFVRQAFELYCTGTMSLHALTKEMYRLGLRNRNGGRITVNGMATILRSPFYIGLMRIERTGQTFRGVHEPLITTDRFEKAQEVLDGKRVDRETKHVFVYSRLVRCGSCGYSLIGERRKGHVYYRCHNRPFKNPPVCPVTSIREEMIDEAILGALADVALTDEELQMAHGFVEERRNAGHEQRRASEQAFRLQSDQIQSRLSKLTDLMIEGTIHRALYETKQKALLLEQSAVRDRMEQIRRGDGSELKEFEKTVELAKSPSLLYKVASLEKKRELLKTLLSNLTVSSKNVGITLSLPFRLIRDREKHEDGGPCRGTCRTWEILFNKIQNYDSVSDRAAA